MSIKKILISFVLFFAMFGLASTSFAKEAKKNVNVVLKEVDEKIQSAISAIPSGNAEEVVELIKVAHESASELSANYKFEFERDKAMGKLKKARDAAKKSDLAATEQELKAAKESFANLKSFI